MTGFIERASCDIYCITDVGRVKSKDKSTAFNSALEAFTLGRMSLNDDVKISAEEAMQVGSPQEEIENNFKLLNSQLGDYLIKAIRNSSLQFFEVREQLAVSRRVCYKSSIYLLSRALSTLLHMKNAERGPGYGKQQRDVGPTRPEHSAAIQRIESYPM